MSGFEVEVARALGRIEQKLDSAVVVHGARLDKLEEDNEQHKRFRWKIIGAITVVGAFLSGLPSKLANAISGW